MQRWQENYIENSHRKCINITANGDFDGNNVKVLYMEADWKFRDFLKAASQRLFDTIPSSTRVFNVDGVEIDDCMMIEDNDLLFISQYGDDFILPVNKNSNKDTYSLDSQLDSAIVNGYKVLNILGKGGFGEADILSIGAAERTVTEIQCLGTLKHHNIIKLLQHTESTHHVILVFELMEGGDLLRYLCKRGSTAEEMSLSEEECRPLFHQIVSGVSYAHNQHICHRDLKLENILLKGPNLSHVKIADFGLSDFYRPGSVVKSNCGTLSFLAPEVFRGTANAGPPLDVWSLGVILAATLTGRLPFEGTEINNRKRPKDNVVKSKILSGSYRSFDNLGPEIKDLIRRLLLVDPDERASIPEIFNHCWMKSYNPTFDSSNFTASYMLKMRSSSDSGSRLTSLGSMSSQSPSPVNIANNTSPSVYSSKSPLISRKSNQNLSSLLATETTQDSLNSLLLTSQSNSFRKSNSTNSSDENTTVNSAKQLTTPQSSFSSVTSAEDNSSLNSNNKSKDYDRAILKLSLPSDLPNGISTTITSGRRLSAGYAYNENGSLSHRDSSTLLSTGLGILGLSVNDEAIGLDNIDTTFTSSNRTSIGSTSSGMLSPNTSILKREGSRRSTSPVPPDGIANTNKIILIPKRKIIDPNLVVEDFDPMPPPSVMKTVKSSNEEDDVIGDVTPPKTLRADSSRRPVSGITISSSQRANFTTNRNSYGSSKTTETVSPSNAKKSSLDKESSYIKSLTGSYLEPNADIDVTHQRALAASDSSTGKQKKLGYSYSSGCLVPPPVTKRDTITAVAGIPFANKSKTSELSTENIRSSSSSARQLSFRFDSKK
eukprot:gene18985-24799_t